MQLKKVTTILISLAILAILTGCPSSVPEESKTGGSTTIKERPNTNPTGYTGFTINLGSETIYVADTISFSISGISDVEGVKTLELLVQKPNKTDFVVDPSADCTLTGENGRISYRLPEKGHYRFKVRFIDSNGLKTDSLADHIITLSITPLVIFEKVVASPTYAESITLQNLGSVTVDLSKFFMKDKGTKEFHPIPQGTVLAPGAKVTFTQTQLRFGINDRNEILELKNPAGYVIDTWTN